MKLSSIISNVEMELKLFFLKHQNMSFGMALFFILCCLYVDYSVISNTQHKMESFEYREGVISYWDRTGGEFNDATLKIMNDTNVYTTQRYDGWLCFQHNGEKGETVSFYTLKNKGGDKTVELPYYGLSKIDNPRSQFWLFFDVLLSCYNSVLIWWLLGLFGCAFFNFQVIRHKVIRLLTGLIWGISLLLYVIANIS